MKTLKYLLIVLSLSVLFACAVDSNCDSLNTDFVTFATYKLDANLQETAYAVKYDSIRSPQTEIVFISLDTLTNIALPLSPVENRTDFYFYYENKTDTISFSYEKRVNVDSPECGIDNQFIGLDTNFQTFDSLIINNDTLKITTNVSNIKIFIE
jgi:hypothetical protein